MSGTAVVKCQCENNCGISIKIPLNIVKTARTFGDIFIAKVCPNHPLEGYRLVYDNESYYQYTPDTPDVNVPRVG